MSRIYQGRASCREVGGRRRGRVDHVGGRASRLEQQSQAPPPVFPKSSELEQQFVLVQERDALRAAAIPTKKRGPVTETSTESSKEAHEVLMTRAARRPVEEDVMLEDAQGLTEWLIDRQCDL